MNNFIQISIDNSIATITLNRPDVLNSFNRTMAKEMQVTLDQCSRNEDVRCIVITGSGRGFCAGQDLDEAINTEGLKIEDIVEESYNPIIRRIRSIEKPIIAKVNGVAAGAGANIALSCDFVIASKNASFIQSFSKIGLIPDSGGTFILSRLVGLARATSQTMLAEKVSAEDAFKMGMIYKYCEIENFEQDCNDLAIKLASMPTKGLGLTKRALNKALFNDLDSQLDYEKQLQSEAGNTNDYKEGVNSFLEKRVPEFKGN